MANEDALHFIGIGGAGMSALARLFLARGARVSGSDQHDSPALRVLAAAGAAVHVGHAAEHLGEARRIVYSAAIPETNPERQEALRRGLPTVSRARLLGDVLDQYHGIAISGTHGKTTTTALAAAIFIQAETDPTVLIGGDWSPIGGNLRVGQGEFCLAEACEAFDSFLELRPRIAAVTNVDADHLEYHGSLEGVVRAFRRFLERVPPEGTAVLNLDDPHLRELARGLPCRTLTFGVEALDADLRAVNLDVSGPLTRFRVSYRGEPLGTVRVPLPGEHTASNALAAIGTALAAGLPFPAAQGALARFQGVERRFERLGEAGGVLVIDDYAHHPREVAATLTSARAALPGRRLWVAFQPHLYSRTRDHLEAFAAALAHADEVLVTGIYAAREQPLPGVTGEALAAAVATHAGAERVRFVPDLAAAEALLRPLLRSGDALIVMGAGDVRFLGENLVRSLGGGAKD